MGELTFGRESGGGEVKNLVEGSYWGGFSQVGEGLGVFSASRSGLLPIPPSRKKPCIYRYMYIYICIYIMYMHMTYIYSVQNADIFSDIHFFWCQRFTAFKQSKSNINWLNVTTAIKHKNTAEEVIIYTHRVIIKAWKKGSIIFLFSLYTAAGPGAPTSLLICVQFISQWETTQML